MQVATLTQAGQEIKLFASVREKELDGQASRTPSNAFQCFQNEASESFHLDPVRQFLGVNYGKHIYGDKRPTDASRSVL